MQKAIVAIEDSRFFQHGPLDLEGLLPRAGRPTRRTAAIKQGGSTLTQQYVKNLLVENAKTDEERRGGESAELRAQAPRAALRRQRREEADQGPDPRGLPQHRLLRLRRVRRAGGLAVLLQQGRLRAHTRRGGAAGRRHQQPLRLRPRDQPQGRHGPAQHRAVPDGRPEDHHQAAGRRGRRGSRSSCTSRSPKTDCVDSKAPFFCEYVKDEILGNSAFGKTLRRPRAAAVPRWPDHPHDAGHEGAVRPRRRPSDLRPSRSKTATEAMVKPGTGEIKAMVVSKDYGDHKKKGQTTLNLAADYAHGGNSGYSAGSTFKIFTLATALNKGMPRRHHAPGADPVRPVSGFTDCKGNHFDAPGHPGQRRDLQGASRPTCRPAPGAPSTRSSRQLEQRVGLCDAVQHGPELRHAAGERPAAAAGAIPGTRHQQHRRHPPRRRVRRVRRPRPVLHADRHHRRHRRQRQEDQGPARPSAARRVDPDVADEVTRILSGRAHQRHRPRQGHRPARRGQDRHLRGPLLRAVRRLHARPRRGRLVRRPGGALRQPEPRHLRREHRHASGSSRWRARCGTPSRRRSTRRSRTSATWTRRASRTSGVCRSTRPSARSRHAGFAVQVSPRAIDSDQRKGTVAYTSPSAGVEGRHGHLGRSIFVSNGNGPGAKPRKHRHGRAIWPFD